MNWDELIVYLLGCLALEQSRTITGLSAKSLALQVHGKACINQARDVADLRSFGASLRERFQC